MTVQLSIYAKRRPRFTRVHVTRWAPCHAFNITGNFHSALVWQGQNLHPRQASWGGLPDGRSNAASQRDVLRVDGDVAVHDVWTGPHTCSAPARNIFNIPIFAPASFKTRTHPWGQIFSAAVAPHLAWWSAGQGTSWTSPSPSSSVPVPAGGGHLPNQTGRRWRPGRARWGPELKLRTRWEHRRCWLEKNGNEVKRGTQIQTARRETKQGWEDAIHVDLTPVCE